VRDNVLRNLAFHQSFKNRSAAFVVPVLEKLYRERWTTEDGLGALIISPTRELAMQIMDVIKKVGGKHYSLSAGLIVGGHDYAQEAAVIGRMNILVATPGRLLQHLEQTPDFSVDQLQVLVLDEADRCLDMGFNETMAGIIDALPSYPSRQTMLFSATQTRDVKSLAGLSLHDPQYVSVHSESDSVTPKQLLQTYVVVPLQDKLNLLYSFLRTHTKNKTIVFMSSCKQTRFLYEAFRRLRPGVPLLHLHGKMKQTRRMHIYYDFLKKPSAALFATDIAARGLDFPSVDWVVQLDCPEDVASYIHRVGRTARFKARGNSLLALLPSEAPAMVPALEGAKIPIRQITVNPESAIAVTPKMAAEVAADPELKYVGQRAYVSYVRSVLLQRNKEIFDVNALPLHDFALSLGLPQPPRVKGLKSAAEAAAGRVAKNAPRALTKLKRSIAARKAAKLAAGEDWESDGESDDEGSDLEAAAAQRTQTSSSKGGLKTASTKRLPHKLAARMATAGGLVEGSGSGSDDDSSDEGGEMLLQPKKGSRARDAKLLDDGSGLGGLVSQADLAKLHPYEAARLERATRATLALTSEMENKKDGKSAFQRLVEERLTAARQSVDGLDSGAIAFHEAAVRSRLQAADTRDKELARTRVRAKHQRDKVEARGGGYTLSDGEDEGAGGYVLGGADSESGGSDGEEEAPSKWAVGGSKRERDDESGERPAAAASASGGSVADAESAALAMLAKRRRQLF